MWTSADPNSMVLLHEATDFSSFVTSGYGGWFGGEFTPQSGLFAAMWEASTGRRVGLPPAGARPRG